MSAAARMEEVPAPTGPADDLDGAAITLDPLDDPDALAPEWQDLERRADGSFFLSWLWIGAWLQVLPGRTDARLLRARCGGRTVALAVVATCPRSRWLLPAPRLRLHEAGDQDLDRLTIEYNGILIDRAAGPALHRRCLERLRAACGPWGEMRIGHAAPAILAPLAAISRKAGWSVAVSPPAPCYGVDLVELRARGTGYVDSLGSNTRSALRRSIRLYEARGPLTLRHAATVEEGLELFAALQELHRRRWEARGDHGAFADGRIVAFHRRLIRTGLPSGHVLLSRVTAGDGVVGYAYNFAWRRHILSYQGGFAYEADNKLKPGLTVHALAIEDALASGAACYDFLAGESAYKHRLAHPIADLHEVRLIGSRGLAAAMDAGRRGCGAEGRDMMQRGSAVDAGT